MSLATFARDVRRCFRRGSDRARMDRFLGSWDRFRFRSLVVLLVKEGRGCLGSVFVSLGTIRSC